MSTAAKPPTANAISRLLAKDFPRAAAQVRGGRAGFSVSKAWGIPGGVEVSHWGNTMADTRQREREMLENYAKVITEAGYRAEYDERRNLLLVTPAEAEGRDDG